MLNKTSKTAILLGTLASGVATYGQLMSPSVRPVNFEYRDQLPESLQKLPEKELQRYPLEYMQQYISNASDYPNAFVEPCRGIKYDGSVLNNFQRGQQVTMQWNIDNMYGGSCSVYLYYNGGNNSKFLGIQPCGTVAGLDSLNVTLPGEDLGCGVGGSCFLQWKWETDVTNETYVNCADFVMDGDSTEPPASVDGEPIVSTIVSTVVTTVSTSTSESTVTIEGNPTVTTIVTTITTIIPDVSTTTIVPDPTTTQMPVNSTYTIVSNGKTTIVVVSHPTGDIDIEGPVDCLVLGETVTATTTVHVLDLAVTTETHTATRVIMHEDCKTSTSTATVTAENGGIGIEDATVIVETTLTTTNYVFTTVTVTVDAEPTASEECTHGHMKCCGGPQQFCICSNGSWVGPYTLTPSASFKCAAFGNFVRVVPV